MYQSSGPPCPKDPGLCEHINRFAAYIAVKGPQTEETERRNNYGNPRFSFLFDGEGASYYQHRLATEINNLKQLSQKPPPTPLSEIRIPAPPSNEPENKLDPEIEPLEAQIQALKHQISESEKNLKAHYDAMLETKNSQVDKLYEKRESDRIFLLLDRVGINYETFIQMVDQLIVSASKETISKCKHWIFSNCDTDQKREICLTYLLYRCRCNDSISGNLRLHILYLINDWAYYCQRQRLDNIRQMISRYVPRLYAHATLVPQISNKLDKLVGVWEGSKYFDENCYKQLVDSDNVLASENATIAAEKSKIGEEVEKELKQTYINYQKQHSDYERHNLNQIAHLQNQITRIQEMKAEHARFQHAQTKERLIPNAPYYELPAGMIVPLIKPESVTFESVNPSELRLPVPSLLTGRLKSELERFYSMLHNPSMDRFDSDGWETKGLSEFYNIKNHHKRKLVENLTAEGKTFEDAITNRLAEQLEQDKTIDPNEHSHRSRSSSASSSSSDSSSSSKRGFARSRSASPDERPTFGGAIKTSGNVGFVKPSSSTYSDTFKMPDLPLQREGNKGAQLLEKLGYSGGGLGLKGQGREEPIDAGSAPHIQDRFRGIGSKGDEYDEFRKRMSQTKFGQN